jgi:hypothetical protein
LKNVVFPFFFFFFFFEYVGSSNYQQYNKSLLIFRFYFLMTAKEIDLKKTLHNNSTNGHIFFQNIWGRFLFFQNLVGRGDLKFCGRLLFFQNLVGRGALKKISKPLALPNFEKTTINNINGGEGEIVHFHFKRNGGEFVPYL